jgi:protease I
LQPLMNKSNHTPVTPTTDIFEDLVKGWHLTCYRQVGVPEKIKKAGGIWEDRNVVVDGNLVTSRWPMDLPAFTRKIIKMVRTNVK